MATWSFCKPNVSPPNRDLFEYKKLTFNSFFQEVLLPFKVHHKLQIEGLMEQSKSRLGNVVKMITNPVFRLAIYVLKCCDLTISKVRCSHINLIDCESQLEFQSNLVRTSGSGQTEFRSNFFCKNELVQYQPWLLGRHNIWCRSIYYIFICQVFCSK